MKTLLLFFISLFIGLGLSVLVFMIVTKHAVVNLIPAKPPTTNFSVAKAPEQSLQGTIATFSGEVDWESRVATIPAQLTTVRPIQQGEEINTKSTGNISVDFTTVATLAISPNTQVDFAQTLPVNLVVAENQGTVTYTKTRATTPLSVRALDLLVNVASGKNTITVDPDEATVTVTVLQGSVTAAFNDTTNTSNVVSIPAGETFTFDDNAKEYTVN